MASGSQLKKILLLLLFTMVTIAGCSTSPSNDHSPEAAKEAHESGLFRSLADCHIDGLKGVEFGQSQEEVKNALQCGKGDWLKVDKKSSHTTEAQNPPTDGVYRASNRKTAKFETITFEPCFLFTGGKLLSITGKVADATAAAEHMTRRFGKPEKSPTAGEAWGGGQLLLGLCAQSGSDPDKVHDNIVIARRESIK